MWLPPVIQPPPSRYQAVAQSALVTFLPQDDVQRACLPLRPPPGLRILGCAIPGPGPCVVVLPTPANWRGTGEAYRQLVLHELGHCSGWPSDHPK